MMIDFVHVEGHLPVSHILLGNGQLLYNCTLSIKLIMYNMLNFYGVTMSSDLTWNKHVENVVAKAGKRVCVLYQLKKKG